jgi:transcriptional regulator with PAS, ATPase and Fis domain
VLVVPMRASGFNGAVYADKLRRVGQFRERDSQLAVFFTDYLALAFGRLAAVEAQGLAFRKLGTTLDTIRDGVIALDAAGVVTNLNSAAARMLRVDAAKMVGRALESEPHLVPLASTLLGSRRVDGVLVRLRHGSFVVTARPIEPASDPRGVVATLVELDRAQRIAQRVTAPRPRYAFRDIVGEHPRFVDALHVARQAAAVDASVLITGDSGTGKEVLAQSIHTAGPRAGEPFVGVKCVGVPPELFGYERGAFTGARSEGNLGKFELAGEGTILLDEIGDMPIDMQAKLLRVLQERVVVRLGGSVERPVHARVVATTHRDIDALVKAGLFRLDLLYRLRVLHVHLPPLAARGEDVVLLARSFLVRFAEQQRKGVREFSDRVLAEMLAYPWPGNVRELANVIEREVSLLEPEVGVLERLQTPLSQARPEDAAGRESSVPPRERGRKVVKLQEVERHAYLQALELSGGHIPRAAAALGVSKVTFYAKLRQWGMHPSQKK